MANFYSNLKSEQIALAHGLVAQPHIDDRAPGFLIIERVMLDVAHDLIALHAFDNVAHGNAGKHRVFSRVLEQSAIARIASKVYAAADRLVVALRTKFAPDDISVKMGRLRVPGRRS